MRLVDRVLWAVATPALWARCLVDHLAGDRRRRPPARDVRCASGALAVSALAGVLLRPSAVDAHDPTVALVGNIERSGGGVMGRLGQFVVRRRRAVILVVGRAADRHRDRRQLGVLGAVDRLRRRHLHRVGPGRPTARRPGRDRRRRSPSSPTASMSTTRRSNATSPPGSRRSPRSTVCSTSPIPWSTQADALRATDGRAALVVVTLAGDLDEDAELAVAEHGRRPRPRARRARGPRRRQRARQRDLRHRIREATC